MPIGAGGIGADRAVEHRTFRRQVRGERPSEVGLDNQRDIGRLAKRYGKRRDVDEGFTRPKTRGHDDDGSSAAGGEDARGKACGGGFVGDDRDHPSRLVGSSDTRREPVGARR